MGLSNGVVMMCTNQRVYEHSGGITGTFYPPVATSQDNQHLYQSSSSSATTTAGSGGGGGGSQATPTYLSAASGGYPGAGSSSPHYSHHARSADAYQGGVMMADDRYSQQQQQQQQTQQHVGYACAGEDEDLMLAGDGVDTHEFDKYLGARLHGHHAPQAEPMDSNHNYHHQQHQHQQQLHAAYYGQPSALDGLGGLLKAEPTAGLSLAQYDSQSCAPQDFSEHHHHAAAAAAAAAANAPAQHIKTEDDFSVILENVRKTCYST